MVAFTAASVESLAHSLKVTKLNFYLTPDGAVAVGIDDVLLTVLLVLDVNFAFPVNNHKHSLH